MRGATQLATLAAISLFDPTGRILKGTKYADGLARSIAQNAALNKLNGMVGTTTAMPGLSTIARNDGMLAEGLAAHFTRELGVEVKVLQNASGHGVDLHAFDATLNRFIVIEVKSSTTGSFGPLPAGTPEDFLKSRAALAAQGQGFWKQQNVPKATRDDAMAIGENFRRNVGTSSAPTVIGYKYEISISKPGQSGGPPTLTVKKW